MLFLLNSAQREISKYTPCLKHVSRENVFQHLIAEAKDLDVDLQFVQNILTFLVSERYSIWLFVVYRIINLSTF